MRFFVTALALLGTHTAYAGGFGLLGTAGMHTETVRFYSTVNDAGVPFENPADYQQYEISQTLPNFGGGLELLLGDRDDRVVGTFRFFYQKDTPQLDPRDVSDVKAANIVGQHREDGRDTALGAVGLSWGFLGNPDNLMAGATAHVGSGFLTTDHTEFLMFDIGPTVMYKIERAVQIHVDVVYTGRVRKGYSHGATGYAGVRYLFD